YVMSFVLHPLRGPEPWLGLVGSAEKSVHQVGISRPGLEKHVSGDGARGVAQGEGYHDHVVEGTDDREEFRNQVDRRDHPHRRYCHCHLGSARHVWVAPQSTCSSNTVRKEAG